MQDQSSRRRFLTGLVVTVSAPAIVRASSLMAVVPVPSMSERIKFVIWWKIHTDENTGKMSVTTSQPEMGWDFITKHNKYGDQVGDGFRDERLIATLDTAMAS